MVTGSFLNLAQNIRLYRLNQGLTRTTRLRFEKGIHISPYKPQDLGSDCVSSLLLLTIYLIYKIRLVYSEQMFDIRTPFGFISVFGLTKLLKLEIRVCKILKSQHGGGSGLILNDGFDVKLEIVS